MVADEREAIARLKRGDIRGLDTLMLTYQVRAVRAAYLVTHDLPLAEDIVQSAFIRAFERIDQFDDERPFGPWFLRSVVNSAVSAIRHRERFVPFDMTMDRDDARRNAHSFGVRHITDPDIGPEMLILQAESREEVWRALDRLPAEQRAAIIMRYYLELPESETAERLGVPPGTVKSRLFNARSRLRRMLGSDSSAPDQQVLATPSHLSTALESEARR